MVKYGRNIFFEMFFTVDNFSPKIIVDHLKALETQFCTYFILNMDFKKVAWIQKLFWIGLSETGHLWLKAAEESADLSSGSNLKLEFTKSP